MNTKNNPGQSNDIGNIVAENVIRHIGVHYSKSGLIPTIHAEAAIAFIENEIEQFNRAVTPGTERSRIVNLLVDRSITPGCDGWRRISRRHRKKIVRQRSKNSGDNRPNIILKTERRKTECTTRYSNARKDFITSLA